MVSFQHLVNIFCEPVNRALFKIKIVSAAGKIFPLKACWAVMIGRCSCESSQYAWVKSSFKFFALESSSPYCLGKYKKCACCCRILVGKPYQRLVSGATTEGTPQRLGWLHSQTTVKEIPRSIHFQRRTIVSFFQMSFVAIGVLHSPMHQHPANLFSLQYGGSSNSTALLKGPAMRN